MMVIIIKSIYTTAVHVCGGETYASVCNGANPSAGWRAGGRSVGRPGRPAERASRASRLAPLGTAARSNFRYVPFEFRTPRPRWPTWCRSFAFPSVAVDLDMIMSKTRPTGSPGGRRDGRRARLRYSSRARRQRRRFVLRSAGSRVSGVLRRESIAVGRRPADAHGLRRPYGRPRSPRVGVFGNIRVFCRHVMSRSGAICKFNRGSRDKRRSWDSADPTCPRTEPSAVSGAGRGPSRREGVA